MRHRLQDAERRIPDRPDQAAESAAVRDARHADARRASIGASQVPAHQHRRDARRRAAGPDHDAGGHLPATKAPPRAAIGHAVRQCPICRSTELELRVHRRRLSRLPVRALRPAVSQPAARPTSETSRRRAHRAADAGQRLRPACGECRVAAGSVGGLCRSGKLRRLLMVANDAFPDGRGAAARSSMSSRSRAARRNGGRTRDRCPTERSMRRCSTARSSDCRDPERCWRTSGARSTASGVVMVIAPDHRQPHGAPVPVGLVGVQRHESALLLGRHAPEPAAQERVRRSDHRRATTARCRSSISARRFRRCRPRFYRRGLTLLVVRDAAVPAAPRVPFVEQPTRLSGARQASRAGADAVGDRSGLQREGDLLDADGSPARQVDRRRGHRDRARRKQFDGRHARGCGSATARIRACG